MHEPDTRRPPARSPLRDNPWFVVTLLFGIAAVFGLPILWSSHGFSRSAKAVLTLVVILYTALLLWLTWLVVAWSLASIRQSLKSW